MSYTLKPGTWAHSWQTPARHWQRRRLCRQHQQRRDLEDEKLRCSDRYTDAELALKLNELDDVWSWENPEFAADQHCAACGRNLGDVMEVWTHYFANAYYCGECRDAQVALEALGRGG
jgi:hypothetical protein